MSIKERYKHLIDTGKAPELLKPEFSLFSKDKQ